MESFAKQNDKEYMKMAMMKHEETFREQVGELHRLYKIQKMLMRDMRRHALKRQQMPQHQNGVLDKSNVENKRIPRQACHRRVLDLERPAEEYADDDDVELESEIELTLATGGRRRKKEDAAFTSDSATSFSSSSTESGGENSKCHEWGLLQMQDMGRGFPGGRKSEFNVDGTVREERMEQPPWLFQCLSLNMT